MITLFLSVSNGVTKITKGELIYECSKRYYGGYKRMAGAGGRGGVPFWADGR